MNEDFDLIASAESKELVLDFSLLKTALEFAHTKIPAAEMNEALAVAETLLDFSPDTATILASVLLKFADLPEPPFAEIERQFGSGVKTILEALHKLSILSKIAVENPANHADILRQMFLALAKDLRVVFVKLANRLYTLRNIHALDEKKSMRLSREVFDLYGPIAARLGIYRLKRQLEDLAFAFLYPDDHAKLSAQVEKILKKYGDIVSYGQKNLEKLLQTAHIPGTVQGRIKDPYSIFQKLRRKETTSLNAINDLFAFRILVPEIADCYASLGHVHQSWGVVSGRFKDYIATPKPNGYRSLHTTVLGFFSELDLGYPSEVQIRTFGMHEESELGSAVHWNYKEKTPRSSGSQKNWFAELAKSSRNLHGAQNFEIFARELLGDKIFVVTEKGDVKILPEGATPLDFAYAVHSEIGSHCQSALVNGAIMPLNSKLQHGDVVKISTNKKIMPRESWLYMVASSSARQKIRGFLHRHEGDFFLREGREKLNAVLKEFGLPVLDHTLSFLKNYESAKALTRKRREIILKRIGLSDLSPSAIVKKITARTEQLVKKIPAPEQPRLKGNSEVFISGEKGFEMKFAHCCNPEGGMPIIAFVTRGGSFTIHKIPCKTLRKVEALRLFPAAWEENAAAKEVQLRIFHRGKFQKIFAEVQNTCARSGIFFIDKNVVSKKKGQTEITATVTDKELTNSVVAKIKNISGVEKCAVLKAA